MFIFIINNICQIKKYQINGVRVKWVRNKKSDNPL